MPIPSAKRTEIPSVNREALAASYRWFLSVFIDASRRQDAVPVTIDMMNFAVSGDGTRIFDEASRERVRTPDVYEFTKCSVCGLQAHSGEDHEYAPRRPQVAMGMAGLYAALMDVDAEWQRLKGLRDEVPAKIESIQSAKDVLSNAVSDVSLAQAKAGTTARLDRLIAEVQSSVAALQSLPEEAPELIRLEEELSQLTQDRDAAMLTKEEDEAAVVSAEAARDEASSSLDAATATLTSLQAEIADLEKCFK